MPAMIVASSRPSNPYCSITPYTTTMKAPVGPPIWTLLPPSNEIKKPATMAVTKPASGSAPEAIAIAMLKGRATSETVMPASASRKNMRDE